MAPTLLTRVAPTLLICAAATLLACNSREAPAPAPAVRGEYLAKLMGCPACHSPDPARPYAGGLEAEEPPPAGPWRTPNLTPHAATGLGRWTDAQIIAAVREGVRPDGRRLHPIMPYRCYRRLTDDDARALVAFLRSLAPLENASAPASAPVSSTAPTSVPASPAAPASAPVSSSAPASPAAPASASASASASPSPSDALARRGEYLVALMHCASCHAAPGPNGSPDPAQPLIGGKPMRPFGAGLVSLGTGTLFASNLTPDRETGIGAWSAADLARAIKSLARPDGSPIRGPMQLYAAGWSVIDDRDLAAIAAYLRQLPPVRNAVPSATFQAR